MKNNIKKHDQFVRKNLTNLDIAQDFLEAHLPVEIKRKYDLSSVQIESGSYIEDDLKTHCADIVYKLKALDNANECLYVYTLVEHQSSAQKFMPFRILRYQVAIIQKHLDEHKGNVDKLPLVVPLVFYNGVKSPYPYECDISKLFCDIELYQKMPLGVFKLIDLTIVEDSEVLKRKKIALLEMAAKHIRDRDFIKSIGVIIQAFQVACNNHVDASIIFAALNYLGYGLDRKEVEPLLHQIKTSIPNYEGVVMSYAEELKEEGRQEARREVMSYAEELKLKGLEEGRHEGRHEAQVEIAQQLLKSGVSGSIIAAATHLSIEEIKQLEKSLH